MMSESLIDTHTRADYEKIFALDDKDIDVPHWRGLKLKLEKLAKTQHIALIKYFTIEMAQSQLSGNAPVDKGDIKNAAGQKFWNTILWGLKNRLDLITKIQLWNILYEKNTLNVTATKLIPRQLHWRLKRWTRLPLIILLTLFKQMEDKNNIDFDPSLIGKHNIKLSEEIYWLWQNQI